ALVAAELARLEPAALWRAAATGPKGELRVRVVRALAEALGMPEPGAVAEAVTVVAGAYFGGTDPAADEAVARLVARLAPAGADEAALEAVANHIGLLVQACDATATLVESCAGAALARARAGAAPVDACAGTAPVETAAGHDGPPAAGAAPVESVTGCDIPPTAGAAPAETCAGATPTDAATSPDVPPALVLREDPPVRTMRRIAARATRVGGREIAEGDVVLLDLVTAQRAHPVPLTFGAPPRVCPGRAHALALTDGLLQRPLTAFARLHHQAAATPLLLPNAWDYASAAALAAQGFPAIGTTSLG
ncbi:isocitrate lyase/phosphoenolpyruvate mutase family protein, partial [Streptomyces sp. 2MCAF27]